MSKVNRTKRVLYAKGGRAIAEAKRLFPLAGQPPSLGPDQFLLSALYASTHAYFRLASLGPKNQSQRFENAEAVEYGLRPDSKSRIFGLLQQAIGLVRFFVSTLFWRPTLILGGIEGPMAMASLFVAKILGAKFVFLVHTDIGSPWLSQRKRALNGFVIQHADAVIVHGPFLCDRALKLKCQPSRLFVFDTGFIPNEDAEEAPKSKTAPVDADAFFYAGRIEVDKGVFDLLNAFENIADIYPVKLVIAGDGSEVERLRAAVSASKHSDKISVTGPIPHSELMHRMQWSIAVVTPTQAIFPEGRCMSAMESLLVGTPVIAPDFGAFPYLVKHEKNGLLYQPDSVSALTQAMAAIASDPDLMARLRIGAKQSGETLMCPERTFLQCLNEATR